MSAVLQYPLSAYRSMEVQDLHQVLRIEQRAYSYPWTPGIFHDCIRVGYCCQVYEEDDKIEAYGVMSVAAGESHILNLCVRPESQGRGLGRDLLRRMIMLAERYRAKIILLEVRPSNICALKIYQKFGFHRVGVRKSYYPTYNGREDALILACDI